MILSDDAFLDFKHISSSGEIVARSFKFSLTEQGNSQVNVSVQVRCHNGVYLLKMFIDGSAHILCQRCLDLFVYPLKVDREYFIADDPFDDRMENYSALEVAVQVDVRHVDLYQLVREEILLSLPTLPKHVNDQCTNKGD